LTSQIPPWSQGPAELIRHALEHLARDGDTDRRLALIGFDNAIEVCVEAFVGLLPRQRGGLEIPRAEAEQALRNYHEKIRFLESYLTLRGLDLGVRIEHILWYHTLRNQLYHSGNGMTPEQRHVAGARDAALAVFRALFGGDLAVDEAGPISPEAEGDALDTVSPSGAEGRLAFLSAYGHLEEALLGALKRKSGSIPALWHDFAEAPQVSGEWNSAVATSIQVRNALVRGDDEAPTDDQLRRLAKVLQAISAAAAESRPAEPPAGNSPSWKLLSGRPLAAQAWETASSVDPDRRGVDVRDLLDLLSVRGYRPRGEEPYRVLYSSLNGAQDIFERVGRGRFAWRAPRPESESAISSWEVVDFAYPLVVARWTAARESEDRMQQHQAILGFHYQDILSWVEAGGGTVRGPDPGRTTYSALISEYGSRYFERMGAGLFLPRERPRLS